MAGNLEALTFDIQLDTTAFEQGVRNVEAILQQLIGGTFQSMGQSVSGIAQNLLGIGTAGGEMSTALTTGGDAAATALQNVQNATRNVETQTQGTALKVESLWTNTARRIEFSMRQALRSFIGPVAAVFGVSSVFSQYTGTADRLGKFAQSMDINLADLQGWSEAAIRAGGSAEGFQGSLRSLNRQLQMMSATTGKKGKKSGASAGGMMGGGLGQLLKEMKIKTKENGKTKDVFQLLTEIAGGAEKMDKQAFAGLAMRSRIDQGTIQLLQKGRAEVERLVERQKKLGVYTEEDTKTAERFKDAVADLSQVFKSFAAIIMRVVTPVITMIADGLVEVIAFINQNQMVIKAFVIFLGGQLFGKLFLWIRGLKVFSIQTITEVTAKFIAACTAWRAHLASLTLSWGTLKAAIGGVLHLLATFVLPFVIEDIFAFFQGKVSYTGDIVYKVQGWIAKGKKAVELIKDKLKKAWEEIMNFFEEKWLALLNKLPEGVRKALGVGLTPEEQKQKRIEDKELELLWRDEYRGNREKAHADAVKFVEDEDAKAAKNAPKTPAKESASAQSATAAKTEEKPEDVTPRESVTGRAAMEAKGATLDANANGDQNGLGEYLKKISENVAAMYMNFAIMASQNAENGIAPVNIDQKKNIKVDQVVNLTQNNTTENPKELADGAIAPVKKGFLGMWDNLVANRDSGSGYGAGWYADVGGAR